MSTVTTFSVLAFASTVFASPYAAYGHGHAHGHGHLHSSSVLYPYPHANSTGGWGSTGLATGTSSCTSTLSAPSYSAPSAPSYSQGGSQGGSETLTSTQYQTVYKTVSYANSASSASVGAGSYGSASGAACGQDVTVTSTEKVYVTVTAGQASSSQGSPVHSYSSQSASYSSSSAPAPASYSSSAAPVSSSSAPAYTAPSYSAPASSSEAAPTSYSSSAAASSYSSPVASSSALPSLSAYTPVNKQVGVSSTASAPASYSSTSSTTGGKRGLAYNSASLLTCFDNSKEITWAYNWVSASAGLTGNLKFIPTLHDGSDTFTSVWNSEAGASISSGSTTLFSFNEPDEPSQANMSPEAAAQAYIKYMNPFAGKAKLCAPSVTNGPASQNMGLTWLQQFIDACGDQCHIDCYNVHWYAPADAQGFKDHVSQAISMAGDKPVWVSEFGCTGASDDQVSTFLEDVMPWMDSNASVAGYAYYMAADGQLITGTQPSTYGNTYMSYTG